MINQGVTEGVYIESDDIVTAEIDNLFEKCTEVNRFPLCPRHDGKGRVAVRFKRYMKVRRRTIPYVHAHVVFSKACEEFIKKWYETCMQFPMKICDEKVLNLLLWKSGCKEYIDHVYDPYFRRYNTGEIDPKQVYMWHGCKRPSSAAKLLDSLINESKTGGLLTKK
jgi:hypothetical protein